MLEQVQFSTTNTIEEEFSITRSLGMMNGRTIVQIDPSYAKKQDFKAGAGPNTFIIASCDKVIILLAMSIATVVAAIVVGIVTLSLTKVAITVAVLGGTTALTAFIIQKSCPIF